jgi:hypothetical protein
VVCSSDLVVAGARVPSTSWVLLREINERSANLLSLPIIDTVTLYREILPFSGILYALYAM